jgi:hypothetical protein
MLARLTFRSLKHFNWIGRHPNVQLVEGNLQLFLESQKIINARLSVGCIGKQTNQVVAIDPGFVRPDAVDGLGSQETAS